MHLTTGGALGQPCRLTSSVCGGLKSGRSCRSGLHLSSPSPLRATGATADTAGAESTSGRTQPDKVSTFRPDITSSWDAKEANGGRGGGADYLYELGQSDTSTNVDAGQSTAHGIDFLFTGNVLGHKSDIADGSLRQSEFRTFNNIVGDYYVSPRFLEEIAMHVVKNYLVEMGSLDKSVRVPLILGIWGEKGMGKTFQTELAFKKLGLEAIIMSAGELEHEWAGTPGKLIRERYRKASLLSKTRGKFACLMINDIDAGIGHHANTQLTVNNQIVVGTLMNLCDHPNTVSIGQDWMADEVLRRTPIIVTGNDFSTLFAPLIRDGRMTKYYWAPTKEDMVPMLWQMYKDDGLAVQDMHNLLDRFQGQPLDFYGALRSSMYDGQIRKWIEEDVVGSKLTWENGNMKELGRRLLKREGLPVFEPVKLVLADLVREGERLEREQRLVQETKLANEYYKPSAQGGRSLIGLSG